MYLHILLSEFSRNLLIFGRRICINFCAVTASANMKANYAMTQHTKGPWVIRGYDQGTIGRPDGDAICHLAGGEV